MIRHLIIETDGAAVQVKACQFSYLEVKSVLEILLDALSRNQFPAPQAALVLPEGPKTEGAGAEPAPPLPEP